MLIAIDGPAGAGKSTVARALAARLGFTYMNSGAMYRCVALLALRRGADGGWMERPGALGELAAGAEIELGARVCLDGADVTAAIGAPEVAELASRVAADPEVREALVEKQRALLADGEWVAEGRDIGTVVAPRADLKVFLTASPGERAQRRAVELQADPAVVLAEQSLRDARDEGRGVSPLERAPEAALLDTTGLSVEEVVERIVGMLGGRPGPGVGAG